MLCRLHAESADQFWWSIEFENVKIQILKILSTSKTLAIYRLLLLVFAAAYTTHPWTSQNDTQQKYYIKTDDQTKISWFL